MASKIKVTPQKEELLEKEGQREYLRLHIFLQCEELKFELIANLNSPGRRHNI